MDGSVQLGDLKRIVGHLGSERLASHLAEVDAASVARVISCIGSTLEESKVKIDPNYHMLRTTEAKAMAGYLRTKYKARAKRLTLQVKRAAAVKKKDIARAAIDARDSMTQLGEKVTEARVSASAELDEQYQGFVEAELARQEEELAAQEVADLFDELRDALADRHEVMVEISRNDRAILKGKEEQ